MKRFLFLITPFALIGCINMEKTSYSKLDEPFSVEATKNYLPKDVSIQPAYTIYEGSQWACSYKTEAGDSICCLESYSTMSPWKYCLLLDENQNAFAFMELGRNEYLRWSEGKQPLFKKR